MFGARLEEYAKAIESGTPLPFEGNEYERNYAKVLEEGLAPQLLTLAEKIAGFSDSDTRKKYADAAAQIMTLLIMNVARDVQNDLFTLLAAAQEHKNLSDAGYKNN